MDEFDDSGRDSFMVDYYTSAGENYKAMKQSFKIEDFLKEAELEDPFDFDSPPEKGAKSKHCNKKVKECELDKNKHKEQSGDTNEKAETIELRPPEIGESIDLTAEDDDSFIERVTRSRRGKKRGSNSCVTRVQGNHILALDSPTHIGSPDSPDANASKAKRTRDSRAKKTQASKGKKTRASKAKETRASKEQQKGVRVLGSPIRVGSPDTPEKVNQEAFVYVSSEGSDLDVETSLNDDEDVNSEMSIKVWWKFGKFDKFNIRRYQKMAFLFEHYSQQENVPQGQILLTLNDVPIRSDDTPDSLKLTIGSVIEGGITTCKDSAPAIQQETTLGENEIELKVQRKGCRQPLLIRLSKTQQMKVFMLKCAENLELPLEKLKFTFDGDLLNPSETPVDLDLEGGECIDLNVLD